MPEPLKARRRTRHHGHFRSRLRLGMQSPDISYVYILRSENEPDRHYTGCTKDLKSRLSKHNKEIYFIPRSIDRGGWKPLFDSATPKRRAPSRNT
ncbi:MAG: GIY-YIG nuclease family protein [Opitutales bacterium]